VSRWIGPCDGTISFEHIIGVSVRATTPEPGWLDAYVEHGLNRWDWAAGALIAAEAGAEVSLPGTAPELGADATYAAAPSIADPLRKVLADCGAAEV